MTITIEEGKYYKRADGSVHGPAERLSWAHETLRWKVGRQSYRDDGGYYVQPYRSPIFDLVAEASAPVEDDGFVTREAPGWVRGVEAEAAEERVKVGQKWRWLGKMETEFFTPGRVYRIVSVDAPDKKHRALYIEDDRGLASNQGQGHSWPVGQIFFDNFEEMIEVVTPSIPELMQELHEAEPTDIKTVIADEAKRIVSGARRSAYGKPEDNFERIARFWDAYFKNTGRDVSITAADVSPLMRLMKEARLCETPDHYDSHVDLAGYTLTGAEVNAVSKPVA